MVAIIGKACVGKTFLLEKAKLYGYSTLNCDDFFAKQLLKGAKCYEIIAKNLGKMYVNESSIDKKVVKQLFLTKNGQDSFEKLIFPILVDHLSKNKYDFVEIPILYSKNGDFEQFFDKTLHVFASEETRKKNAKFKNVDNYDITFYDLINSGFYKVDSVGIDMDKIDENIDWKSFFKTHYI